MVGGPDLVVASPCSRISVGEEDSLLRTRYYGGHELPQRQRTLYLLAMVAASVRTVSDLGYWGWRVCGLYQITAPWTVLIILERFMYLSEVLSAVAIICFFLGRGPYRFALVLTTLWVMLPILCMAASFTGPSFRMERALKPAVFSLTP